MVRTGAEQGIVDRGKDLFFHIWAMIYLFFATIFITDTRKLSGGDDQRWGGGGRNAGAKNNMNGLKRSGASMRGGG